MLQDYIDTHYLALPLIKVKPHKKSKTKPV